MAKVTIIGSDSYIATQYYEAMVRKHSLKIFSRQSSGKTNENIKDLFNISTQDLSGADVVINFAAIVHQPKVKDKLLYHRVNTKLPIDLAANAKKAGVQHFIQFSSVSVYGSKELIDEHTVESPINLYGESKLQADICLLNMQSSKFVVSIIRPPMVYGSGLAPGNLRRIVELAQKGFPMPFKGINNKRDFIHVNNLLLALNLVIDNKLGGITIPTDLSSVSTERIIKLVKKYSRNKIRLFAMPGTFNKVLSLVIPDLYNKVWGNLEVKCSLSESDYKPKFNIEDGIREMLLQLPIS